MRVASLFVMQFRNHERLEVNWHPGLNGVVGPNGAGKTNLLEALDLVATGRTHRARREVEVIRFGADWAVVRASFYKGSREHRAEIRIERTGLKHIRVDGAPTSRAGLLGRAVLVSSGPEDTQVVSGAASERRRLLDGVLCQLSAAYYEALLRYHRVARHRNRLLRVQAPAAALAVWDEQLVELGVTLVERRRKLVERLEPAAAAWAERLGCGPVAVRYLPGLAGEREAAYRQLARERREELRRGVSLVGPHRDDLEILADGVEARAFASRGQQRAVTLALRLAQAEVIREELGEYPILLLDDVVVDLDRERCGRLLRALEGGPQVVLTATDRQELRCDHYVKLEGVARA